jgi:hypothetical protein
MMSELHLQNLTPFDVVSVYTGTNGKCCCGCAGKHRYNSKYVTEASQRRGYAVTPDEVSDRSVLRVLNSIKAGIVSGELEFGNGYIARVTGTRVHIIYLAK